MGLTQVSQLASLMTPFATANKSFPLQFHRRQTQCIPASPDPLLRPQPRVRATAPPIPTTAAHTPIHILPSIPTPTATHTPPSTPTHTVILMATVTRTPTPTLRITPTRTLTM